jgi:hypothetical protein
MRNMKNLLLPALIFLLSTASCTVNDNGDPIAVYTQTYIVEIADWLPASDESGDYYYYEFREPALTRYIYENGMMNAYLKIDEGLNPLPFDDFWIGRDGYRWTEQVTCEFRPGYVTFFFKSNDHGSKPYYKYTFYVKFMW